jgi:phenylacetate-CoA ligase
MRSLQPSGPTPASSLYAHAYGGVLFPAWQRLVRRRRVKECFASLQASQWLDEAELERQQLTALRALLDHARSNVPYYRELFGQLRFDPRQVRTLSDLGALPVLTRETIQERYADLLDPSLLRGNVRKGTSGTTGTRLSFEYSNESEAWRQATKLRGYGWAGYRLGLPTLYYWGSAAEAPRGLAAGKVRLDRAARREVYIDAIKQDEASLLKAIEVLRRMRPHVVVAYTQALVGLARYAIEQGRRDWPDTPILCAAEPILPGDREVLERAFGPHVHETYGSRETMLVAAECGAHEGMHLSDENLVVEIARSGEPVHPGVSGDVLVTDLHNYRMPFIRYANGDVATMSPEGKCPCGRSLRRLSRLEGRRVDMLGDANGEPVSGMLFISLLQGHERLVRAFQVVQKRGGGDVEFKVVRGAEWDEARFEAMVQRARQYLKGLPVRVVFCDEIAPSKSGKRRPVVVED